MSMIQEDQDRNQFDWTLLDDAETTELVEEQKKKELVQVAAVSLFANKGFAGTSVREIVDAAGVTKPTLYYYFKNKEDLYLTLIDEALQTFFQTLNESFARPGTMRQRLVRFYTSIYQLFAQNLDFLRLINLIIYGPRTGVPQYDLKERNGHLERVFTEVLEAGIAEGELRRENSGEVMLLLLGLLRSMQFLLVMKPGQPGLTPDGIARAIDIVFDGPRATPRNVEGME